MSGLSEQEYLLRERNRCELAQRRIDRREFITRSLVTGLGLAGASVRVAKSSIGRAFAADRPLTPTFYPVGPGSASRHCSGERQVPEINYQIAPVEGFGDRALRRRGQVQAKHMGRLCRPDAIRQEIMSALVKADVTEPWD